MTFSGLNTEWTDPLMFFNRNSANDGTGALTFQDTSDITYSPCSQHPNVYAVSGKNDKCPSLSCMQDANSWDRWYTINKEPAGHDTPSGPSYFDLSLSNHGSGAGHGFTITLEQVADPSTYTGSWPIIITYKLKLYG